jgi:DNA-binding response OmpR family regulator
MTTPAVLVVEDGHEYTTNLERFLGDAFRFVRAGDGEAALAEVSTGAFQAIFLDMRFDRSERLLGDLGALVRRFSGDEGRARRFLEDNQGTYVLAALRQAGCTLPVVFSYDFDGEPRRFANLSRRHGPLAYLNDTAGPAEMRAALTAAVRGR